MMPPFHHASWIRRDVVWLHTEHVFETITLPRLQFNLTSYFCPMARKPRIHFPGGIYHVMLRGNGRHGIFYIEDDRYHLCLPLQEGINRFQYRVHGFCLMTNHLHLAIQVSDKPLFPRVPAVLDAFRPFKQNVCGIAVESTFNWYWPVDGLMGAGYRVHLVIASAVKQYKGLKHTDDDTDTFWLAHLLRLGILPTRHIYAKETRPLRDLLHKRSHWVSPTHDEHLEPAEPLHPQYLCEAG